VNKFDMITEWKQRKVKDIWRLTCATTGGSPDLAGRNIDLWKKDAR
jgi:hypothetical protein